MVPAGDGHDAVRACSESKIGIDFCDNVIKIGGVILVFAVRILFIKLQNLREHYGCHRLIRGKNKRFNNCTLLSFGQLRSDRKFWHNYVIIKEIEYNNLCALCAFALKNYEFFFEKAIRGSANE